MSKPKTIFDEICFSFNVRLVDDLINVWTLSTNKKHIREEEKIMLQ